MAKTINKKTSRKKKTANAKHKESQIVRACRIVLNEMYLSFSSTHMNIVRHKTDKLEQLVTNKPRTSIGKYFTRGSNDLDIAKIALNDDLAETPRVWHYWIGAFTDKGDDVSVEIECGAIHATNELEIGSEIPLLFANFCDDENIDETELTAWAWMAAPTASVDLENSSDYIIRSLIEDYDILNKDKQREVATHRQLKALCAKA